MKIFDMRISVSSDTILELRLEVLQTVASCIASELPSGCSIAICKAMAQSCVLIGLQ